MWCHEIIFGSNCICNASGQLANGSTIWEHGQDEDNIIRHLRRFDGVYLTRMPVSISGSVYFSPKITARRARALCHPNRCFILRNPENHISGFSRLMKYSKASIRDRKGSDQVKSSWTFSSDILLVQRCKVVIGGGDTAVDCVGTSIRFSAYILRFVFLYGCTAQEFFEWFGAGGSRIWWHWIITCWGRRSVPPSAPPRYYLRLLSLLWLFWSYLFFDPPNWFYDPHFFLKLPKSRSNMGLLKNPPSASKNRTQQVVLAPTSFE